MSFENILEFRLRQKINVHVKYEIRVRIIDSNITQFIDRNIRLQNNKHNVITGWSDKACLMVFLCIFFTPIVVTKWIAMLSLRLALSNH